MFGNSDGITPNAAINPPVRECEKFAIFSWIHCCISCSIEPLFHWMLIRNHMTSIKPCGVQWPWMTLDVDISYCRLLNGQYFKMYYVCHILYFIRTIGCHATYSESAATGRCQDTRIQYRQFQAWLLQRCSLLNTELDNPEAKEGAESEIRNHLFWCCSQWLDWYNVSKLLIKKLG